jgi:hypothetical protein
MDYPIRFKQKKTCHYHRRSNMEHLVKYDMIYDMIRYDTWYDIYCIWYDIWYGVIWYMIWYDIFNRNWVDARWQQYSTHLHINSTQNTENPDPLLYPGEKVPCIVAGGYVNLRDWLDILERIKVTITWGHIMITLGYGRIYVNCLYSGTVLSSY